MSVCAVSTSQKSTSFKHQLLTYFEEICIFKIWVYLGQALTIIYYEHPYGDRGHMWIRADRAEKERLKMGYSVQTSFVDSQPPIPSDVLSEKVFFCLKSGKLSNLPHSVIFLANFSYTLLKAIIMIKLTKDAEILANVLACWCRNPPFGDLWSGMAMSTRYMMTAMMKIITRHI